MMPWPEGLVPMRMNRSACLAATQSGRAQSFDATLHHGVQPEIKFEIAMPFRAVANHP